MNIISYIHKSVELIFQILGRVEIWTRRGIEQSPYQVCHFIWELFALVRRNKGSDSGAIHLSDGMKQTFIRAYWDPNTGGHSIIEPRWVQLIDLHLYTVLSIHSFVCYFVTIVPDSKSRNIPEVFIVRRGASRVLGIWRGWVSWVKGGANGVSLQATWEGGGRFLSQLEGAK